MKKVRSIIQLYVGLTLVGSVARAQSPIPVREIAQPAAISARTFGLILNVRALTDGKLLVNDGGSRQLLVLDSLLSNAQVVLDSVAGAAGSYGARSSPLIGYPGDSSLFVDRESQSLLLITPNGKTGRVVSAPTADIVRLLTLSASGTDLRGNLIFLDEPTLLSSSSDGKTMSWSADSSAILRADFDTRKVDTIAQVRIANGSRTESSRSSTTVLQSKQTVNPLIAMDEWAVTTDGSIAIVRGHDYHVDWIRPDGSRMSTPKLPFDWKRLTDSDKLAISDSNRADWQRGQARADSMQRASAGPGPQRFTVTRTLEYVPHSEMAEYLPPMRSGAVKADNDNNIWILPWSSTHSRNGELVYDVVNNKGQLTHRVRLPVGHSIAGFGKRGVVFLMNMDGNRWVLKRSRVLDSRR